MSNRRRPNQIMQTLAALDGAHLPGGCDECDAYQTVRIDGPGLGMVAVHHDDWCPFYQRMSR